MRLYTLHAREARGDGDRPRTRLVREGASLWAFVFGPLWLAARGLWLAFLGTLVAFVALALAVPAALAPAAGIAFQLLFALHARDLERWTLRRRGYATAGVVAGADDDDALLRALAARPNLAPGVLA